MTRMRHERMHSAIFGARISNRHRFSAEITCAIYIFSSIAVAPRSSKFQAEAKEKKACRKVEVAKIPRAGYGRAIANGCDYGFTKLIFDHETHRGLGGAIVNPSAGDTIGEVALAIKMGCDAVDIGKIIHPHPTLGESIGMAAEMAHGSCTDLPPMKKK